MSYYNKQSAKILASILIFIFLGFLLYILSPYLQAFITAIIVSIVFLPLYKKLEKKLSLPKTSASIVIIISILIIFLPIIMIAPLIYQQINNILFNEAAISQLKNFVSEKIAMANIGNALQNFSQNIGHFVESLFSSILGSVTSILINLTIVFFTMFYILLNNVKLKKFTLEIIPFKKENNQKLITNFKDIIKSTIVSTFLIALFQAVLLGLTFFVLDIPGYILWAVLAFIMALFPIIGIPLVWVPATAILYIQGNIKGAIIITIVGLILSNVDIFIRSWLQKKYGKIHPLITFIGVVMGVRIFGIIGIFIGPILISYFLLMMKMYKEEYL